MKGSAAAIEPGAGPDGVPTTLPDDSLTRAQKWQQVSEWPLTVCAVGFLVIYAWQVLGDLQGEAFRISELASLVIWLVFITDYFVLLILAENRKRWFIWHLHDLAIVALPLLRPLRLLRLLAVLAVFQRSAGDSLRAKVGVYVAGAAVTLIFGASLAMLEEERHAPGSTITHFSDALWWAITTVTTVGYGDTYPTTNIGRAIAVGLMLCGVALIGLVTATVASWLVQKVAERDEAGQLATRHQVMELTSRLDALTQLLETQLIRHETVVALAPGSGAPVRADSQTPPPTGPEPAGPAPGGTAPAPPPQGADDADAAEQEAIEQEAIEQEAIEQDPVLPAVAAALQLIPAPSDAAAHHGLAQSGHAHSSTRPHAIDAAGNLTSQPDCVPVAPAAQQLQRTPGS